VITLKAQVGGIRVEQWCEAPTLYLDHWAWKRISEDGSLAAAFANTVAGSGGTVAMFWLNLVEFCIRILGIQRRFGYLVRARKPR